jgi:hypothetical protein
MHFVEDPTADLLTAHLLCSRYNARVITYRFVLVPKESKLALEPRIVCCDSMCSLVNKLECVAHIVIAL